MGSGFIFEAVRFSSELAFASTELFFCHFRERMEVFEQFWLNSLEFTDSLSRSSSFFGIWKPLMTASNSPNKRFWSLSICASSRSRKKKYAAF